MRRPSAQTQAVVGAFLARPAEWAYGYDLIRELGVASGSLYPILMRLHERGTLETRWEDSPTEGRPRRHMYRLTEEGRRWGSQMIAERSPVTRINPVEGIA